PPQPPLFPYTTLFRSISPQRLARRPDGRSDAARVRLRKEVTARELVPEPAEVAVGAGIADHAGAQKDDQLRLPRQIAARRKRLRSEEHTSELQSPCNL